MNLATDISPTHSITGASRVTFSPHQSGSVGGFKVTQQGVNSKQAQDADAFFDTRNGVSALMGQRAGELRREGSVRKALKNSEISDLHDEITTRANDQLWDLTNLTIKDLHEAIKNLQKRQQLTPFDARQLVEEYFDDPSLQHGALLAIAHMEEQMGENNGLVSVLKNVAQTLMEEQGPAIRAGYNINYVISLYADGDLDTFKKLRETYRATLLSDMSEEQIYDFLVHIFPSRLRRLLFRKPGISKDKQNKKRPAWEEWEDDE